MENIELLWKTTNENVKRANKVEGKNALTYNNINKWSPADIYLASADAQRNFKKLATGQKVSIKVGNFKITFYDTKNTSRHELKKSSNIRFSQSNVHENRT